jgi:hypothetical protein
MSTRTVITAAEVAVLQQINSARAPLQEMLSTHARQLLEVWWDRKKTKRRETNEYSPEFVAAELIEDGSAVKVMFDCGYDGFYTEEFPIAWFLDSAWLQESDALIKSAGEDKV